MYTRMHACTEQTTSIPERGPMHVPETAAAQRSLVNRAPRRRGEENKARYPRHTYEGHYLERQTSLKMRQGLCVRLETHRRFIYRYCCAPPFLHLPPSTCSNPPRFSLQHPPQPFSNPR